MSEGAYAKSGVDIALGNAVKSTLPELLASATRPEVLGEVGGFGGLFALDTKRFDQPVLVSSVDGVGTKLKVAFAANRHDSIGEDLVNHCVNDIAVCGAEPLFFLDYLGAGTLEPSVFEEILKGFARGCASNHCALLGGETAQMPGFYQKGEYDVSGCIVGVVDRPDILDGKDIEIGDVVLGVASNGLHTNGYSLARQAFFTTLGFDADSPTPWGEGTVADELLRTHRSYLDLIQSWLKPQRDAAGSVRTVKAFAHITGGGFQDNIPRSLPDNLGCEIQKGSWPILPVFDAIQKAESVSFEEMHHVFNMGIGLTAVVSPQVVDSLIESAKSLGREVYRIGTIVERGANDAVVFAGERSLRFRMGLALLALDFGSDAAVEKLRRRRCGERLRCPSFHVDSLLHSIVLIRFTD